MSSTDYEDKESIEGALSHYMTVYHDQVMRSKGKADQPTKLYLTKREAMILTIGTDIDHRLPMMFMGVPIEIVDS